MKKSELRKIIREEIEKVDKPEADAAITLASKGFEIEDKNNGDHWYWEMENGNTSPASLKIEPILNLAKKYPDNYKNGILKFGPRS